MIFRTNEEILKFYGLKLNTLVKCNNKYFYLKEKNGYLAFYSEDNDMYDIQYVISHLEEFIIIE